MLTQNQDHYQWRVLDWPTLAVFIANEQARPSQDADRDVLLINQSIHAMCSCEGLFHGERLVGFARFDQRRHLSTIYVSPEHRGKGLTAEYIRQRRFVSLQVRVDNPKAKALYERLGFMVVPVPVANNRYWMLNDWSSAA